MKPSILSVIILVTLLALAACGSNNDDESDSDNPAAAVQGSAYTAAANPDSNSAFDISFEGALPPTTQMMLGILKLEETGHAVTGAQAGGHVASVAGAAERLYPEPVGAGRNSWSD